MNWKKLILVAVVVAGFSFAAAPRSEAGVSVGIGIGAPIGFGYYGGYARPYYPYGYGYAPFGYYAPGYTQVVYRPYYWSHGRRIYYARHHRHWR